MMVLGKCLKFERQNKKYKSTRVLFKVRVQELWKQKRPCVVAKRMSWSLEISMNVARVMK